MAVIRIHIVPYNVSTMMRNYHAAFAEKKNFRETAKISLTNMIQTAPHCTAIWDIHPVAAMSPTVNEVRPLHALLSLISVHSAHGAAPRGEDSALVTFLRPASTALCCKNSDTACPPLSL
eukprot:6189562-Pleurochrysis_carterae.AAC.2